MKILFILLYGLLIGLVSFLTYHQSYHTTALIFAGAFFSVGLREIYRRVFGTKISITEGTFPLPKNLSLEKKKEILAQMPAKLQELCKKYQTRDMKDPRIQAEIEQFMNSFK